MGGDAQCEVHRLRVLWWESGSSNLCAARAGQATTIVRLRRASISGRACRGRPVSLNAVVRTYGAGVSVRSV